MHFFVSSFLYWFTSINAPGRGVLTYIWFTGMCRSNVSLFWKQALKTGVGFWAGKSLNTGLVFDFSPIFRKFRDQIPKNGVKMSNFWENAKKQAANFEFSGKNPYKQVLFSAKMSVVSCTHPPKPDSSTLLPGSEYPLENNMEWINSLLQVKF